MSDDTPSLHIDTDWKKQAQEEKRKMAEAQEKQRAEEAKKQPAAAAARSGGGARGQSQAPSASFAALVNSVLTQVMLYLGELIAPGQEPMVNLDMARYQVDLLGIIEQKTANNLTPEEQELLDTVAYEARTRFIAVTRQYIS